MRSSKVTANQKKLNVHGMRKENHEKTYQL